MILAMDTSTNQASVALFDEEKNEVVSEHSWLSNRRHTTELMPKVDVMVQGAGLSVSDLSAVAVALGPGSYTGLRISLSAAKGIVSVVRKPIIGIPTLDVTAYPHLDKGLPVLAILQAGRRRVCWAIYAPSTGARIELIQEYELGAIDEMARSAKELRETLLVAGEVDREVVSALEAADVRYRTAFPGTNVRRAGYLAAMASERLSRGEQDDPVTLSPLYLPKEI